MTLKTTFKPMRLDRLQRAASVLKAEGYRFIQTHAVNTDDGVDLYYSFMKDGEIVNYRIQGVKPGQPVPSITDQFLAAFVFENEARELFGVDMRDIAIDFGGAMYAPAESEPMTFMSPAQKAARDKARAAAVKKAASAPVADAPQAAPAAAPSAGPAKTGFVMTPERQARLDAKMATMSPEKKAKVEAALAARAAEAAAPTGSSASASPQEEFPVGAHSVRPADSKESAKAGVQPAAKPITPESASASSPQEKPPAVMFADEQLASLIGLMDTGKADKVRAALNLKGGE